VNKTTLVLGREPAFWLGAAAAAIQLVSAFFFHLTADQQAVLNGVAAGVLGLIVAVIVHDGIVAAVVALFQAALGCALGFGLHWTPDQQSTFMLFVTAVAAGFVRSQVEAKVSAQQLRAGLRLAA
jgi:hypothetical protein